MNGLQEYEPFLEVDSSDEQFKARILEALTAEVADVTLPIGVIGCGWIAGMQLEFYRDAGFNVVALCDHTSARAMAYRDKYYPYAGVYTDTAKFLDHPGLQVVDIATHVKGRPALIRQAMRAGKHVLSQKPFVEDICEGRDLAADASALGLQLAVNQNGRWAPHFAAMLACVNAGLIGAVVSGDFFTGLAHDQTVESMPTFANMQDLVLYDLGSHWFDIVAQLTDSSDLRVLADFNWRPEQVISAPVQAAAMMSDAKFCGSVVFRGGERFAEAGSFRVAGTRGLVTYRGGPLGGASVHLETEDGVATVRTDSDWFRHGLTGSMRALLVSISSGRPPVNSAGSALRGLELCFAAVESARVGRPIRSGEVQNRPRWEES